MAHSAVYKCPTRTLPGLSDLRTYKSAERPRDEADAVEVEVTSTLTVTAPVGIAIDTVVLQRKAGGRAEVAHCSIDHDNRNFAGGRCAWTPEGFCIFFPWVCIRIPARADPRDRRYKLRQAEGMVGV